MSAVHPYIEYLIDKAGAAHPRVAVPDAQFDERVLAAACRVHQDGWLDVVLTGSRSEIYSLAGQHGLNINGLEIIDPDEFRYFEEMCDEYASIRDKDNLSIDQVRQLIHEPIYFACMLHRRGLVHGVCSGVHYSTGDVARPAIKILGLQPGIGKVSAMVVMTFSHIPLGDDLVLAAADPAIIPYPTAEELADIAILSADKAGLVLPEKPRVAMLSFSTLGSARNEMVDKVVRALDIVKERRPDICIDGEFQFDTAVSPAVAAKKIKRASEVAGRANVLVFPDLQSGNIACKAMLLMGDGMLVGEPLLGLNGCVSDHSRGASIDEIAASILFTGAQLPVESCREGTAA
ncbi:MAG: phosphate acetyltransferase [Armatimonadetes bacterium]|nr:phosphate acetyltransferase [Armatimonadota bacterium]